MQLSGDTIKILKNASLINPSIFLKEGSIVRTMSPQKNFLAEFEIEQSIDGEMCIYDISSFLNMLSLFDENYEIEIEDKKAVINDGSNKGTFFFAHPDSIISPPDKNLKLENSLAEFTVSEKVFSKAKKAAGTLNAEDFILSGDGENVTAKVTNRKNNTANQFNQTVGESDKEFEAVLDVSKLTFLPGDYKVTVYEQAVYFESEVAKYWITCK